MATVEKDETVVERPLTASPTVLSRLLTWPGSAMLVGVSVLALFIPAFVTSIHLWITDERHAHGVFIFPISAFVLYLQRRQIRDARISPTGWGFLPFALGLFLYSTAYLLRIKILLLWMLIPTLFGGVLLLHGWQLWRVLQFPVLYLSFAAQFPFFILNGLNLWIKAISTTGAVITMRACGYSILQTGNLVQIPGYSLEVGDVCSGFKKLVALVAFSVLYGYIFAISPLKRFLLVLVAVPIAVLANVLRVSGLIAVTSFWGMPGLKVAHNWAELVVLVLAFMLFVLVGKALGCRSLRFSPSSAS
jgi:exosortase